MHRSTAKCSLSAKTFHFLILIGHPSCLLLLLHLWYRGIISTKAISTSLLLWRRRGAERKNKCPFARRAGNKSNGFASAIARRAVALWHVHSIWLSLDGKGGREKSWGHFISHPQLSFKSITLQQLYCFIIVAHSERALKPDEMKDSPNFLNGIFVLKNRLLVSPSCDWKLL